MGTVSWRGAEHFNAYITEAGQGHTIMSFGYYRGRTGAHDYEPTDITEAIEWHTMMSCGYYRGRTGAHDNELRILQRQGRATR